MRKSTLLAAAGASVIAAVGFGASEARAQCYGGGYYPQPHYYKAPSHSYRFHAPRPHYRYRPHAFYGQRRHYRHHGHHGYHRYRSHGYHGHHRRGFHGGLHFSW